jgi:hypothetical protein
MPREEKLTVRTDKNGRYALDLLADTPAGSRCPRHLLGPARHVHRPRQLPGHRRQRLQVDGPGYVDVTYNGQAYCLPMDGTSFDPFTSAGAERGWAYPEKALAQLNPTLWVEGLSARKEYTIKLKLVPDGPLWNGSKGQPIELTLKTDRVDRGVALFGWRRDIPLGRYRLTAALVEANGRERALSVASVLDRAGGSPWNAKYGQYGASVVVNFEQPHCSETPLRAIGLKVG